MIKRLLALIIIVFCLVGSPVFGEDASNDYSTTIDLGEGNGAIVITGNGNTIYLPPPKSQECEVPRANKIGDGFVLALPGLQITYGSVRVDYQRVILYIDGKGFTSVVYAEQ